MTDDWELYEGGYQYDTVTAKTATDALTIARENVDPANYDITETIWVKISVKNDATGEEDDDTVALHPEPPDCTEEDHDWQSPHDIVGGIKENPGVWGHGGGVIIKEVCSHCGIFRTTDTWAQNPETGEQGLESTEYQEAYQDY